MPDQMAVVRFAKAVGNAIAKVRSWGYAGVPDLAHGHRRKVSVTEVCYQFPVSPRGFTPELSPLSREGQKISGLILLKDFC